MTTQLTPAQQTALLADIGNNTNQVSVDGGTLTAISAVPHSVDASFAVAAWYNLQPGTAFYAYYNGVPVHSIIGSIRWKRLTPSDAISVANYLQQSSACQGIQFNIQLLLGFQSTLDATQNSVVQGFSDALSAVPSGTNGAVQDAGWTSEASGDVTQPTLPQVLSRLATNVEKLFANTAAWGQGGSGNSQTPGATGPATLIFQGTLQPTDVQTAWGISS